MAYRNISKHFYHEFTIFNLDPNSYEKLIACQSLYRRHSQSGDLQAEAESAKDRIMIKGIFQFTSLDYPLIKSVLSVFFRVTNFT